MLASSDTVGGCVTLGILPDVARSTLVANPVPRQFSSPNPAESDTHARVYEALLLANGECLHEWQLGPL